METYLQKHTIFNFKKDSLLSHVFVVNKQNDENAFVKIYDFLNDKNTKSNALLGYWGAETIVDSVLVAAFVSAGLYFMAFLATALMIYRTYAILGVLFEMGL